MLACGPVRVSYHVPTRATTGRSLTSPLTPASPLIEHQQQVNHGEVMPALEMGQADLKARSSKT